MATQPQQQLAYGVAYSPDQFDGSPPSSHLDIAHLASGFESDIAYVRVQWVDLVNQIRFKVLSRSYFLKIVKNSPRPGITIAAACLGLVASTCAPGFTGIGELLYEFDLNTLRRATYEPGHAVVMGYFREEVPKNESLTVALCPRTLLKRIEEDAEKTAGIRFLAGVEHEFILLSSTSPAKADNTADWSTSAKLASGSIESKVLQEIATTLQMSGIEVQMYHGEGAAGQYEVITGPLPPLAAADCVVFTRETIYNVAIKHGLRATFAPVIRPGTGPGSAAHHHVSVHDVDRSAQTLGETKPYQNPNFGPTLTSTERSFLQGVLTHLRSLCALTLPIPNSYARAKDGMWSGGTYVSWGTDNREAPVRLTGSPGGHHFEIRSVDATANPYIAIAAIVGAGAWGVKQKAKLTYGDCRKEVAKMSEEERLEVGIGADPVRMARTFEEARSAMEESEFIRSLFGEKFMKGYLSVNQFMADYLSLQDNEAKITRLVTTY